MSFKQLEEIICACGENFESELYQSVTVRDDPDLKDLILAGELNLVKCPSCFRVFYAERFVLYHDFSQELMAFIYPQSMESKKEEMRIKMDLIFAQLQSGLSKDESLSYPPRLFFGLETLCDLLNLEEALQDEAVVVLALCKHLKLNSQKIRRDLARTRGIPPLLPLESISKDFRKNLLAGLKKILKVNDRLVSYQQLLSQVESSPDWTLR